MLPIFDAFREVTLDSTALRLILAVLCGGLVGIERSYKKRPAGFRTHILICLGASITTLTSQFLYLNMHYFTDMARFGAQVVAGIGFIGAGAIIVTPRKRVKGLTTAAGLWTSAIVGLALGGGFYEAGILTTLLILCTELFFSRFEFHVLTNAPEINLYMEYTDRECLEEVLRVIREKDIKLLDIEITRSSSSKKHNASALFALRLNKKCPPEMIIMYIEQIKGVLSAQEI